MPTIVQNLGRLKTIPDEEIKRLEHKRKNRSEEKKTKEWMKILCAEFQGKSKTLIVQNSW